MLMQCYQFKSIVCIRVRPWCCTFFGFSQMCDDLYLPLGIMQSILSALKILGFKTSLHFFPWPFPPSSLFLFSPLSFLPSFSSSLCVSFFWVSLTCGNLQTYRGTKSRSFMSRETVTFLHVYIARIVLCIPSFPFATFSCSILIKVSDIM